MKKLLKLLVLAQVASDSGKGYYNLSHNCNNAVKKGYNLKDVYILQALAMCQRIPSVQYCMDVDSCLDMVVVLFDTHFGQISFHTFLKEKSLKKYLPNSILIEWDQKVSGSKKTAKKISKQLNLQTY